MKIVLEHLPAASGDETAGRRETILTGRQTLALARILNAVIPEMRRIAHPEIQYLAACFQDYLRTDADLHERNFTAFYEKLMAAGPGDPTPPTAQDGDWTDDEAPPLRDACAVDADVRVFLGRLLLSGEIITPALARQLAPVLGLLCGLLSQYETQARREQPALVRPLRFAYRTISTIAVACDGALERSGYLRLSVES
ncbi:MAG: hypothetical protein Kow0059_06350 [Candidatus Sumerlaeia bacterium]